MTPFVNIHTHNSIDNKDIIEIKNIDIDEIVDTDVSYFYSIGIHPWNVDDNSRCENTLTFIERNIEQPGFLAIGECGLDRTSAHDFNRQKEIFIKQIKLSEQNKKPLILHAVRSYSDIIAIRKDTKSKTPWIIHGFQGNEQTTEQLLRHELYLSFGDVLFKNENKARRLLQIIPTERLFLETDTAEREIDDVYKRAASLKSIDIDTLRNDIFNNFVKIFGHI